MGRDWLAIDSDIVPCSAEARSLRVAPGGSSISELCFKLEELVLIYELNLRRGSREFDQLPQEALPHIFKERDADDNLLQRRGT